jgi:hypothetical protein
MVAKTIFKPSRSLNYPREIPLLLSHISLLELYGTQRNPFAKERPKIIQLI